MDLFMNQPWYAIAGEIVLFANTATIAMPSRWRDNIAMDYLSKILNFIAMNVFKNKNMDDTP
jgi:hypothetical protein